MFIHQMTQTKISINKKKQKKIYTHGKPSSKSIWLNSNHVWYICIKHTLITCMYLSQRQRISWSLGTSKSSTLCVKAGKKSLTWSLSQLLCLHGSINFSESSKNRHLSSRVRWRLQANVIIDLQYERKFNSISWYERSRSIGFKRIRTKLKY